jgi:hypothetical protein
MQRLPLSAAQAWLQGMVQQHTKLAHQAGKAQLTPTRSPSKKQSAKESSSQVAVTQQAQNQPSTRFSLQVQQRASSLYNMLQQ